MRLLLTTSQSHPRESFQFWQNAVSERFIPVELHKVGGRPFEGKLESADVGPLSIARVTQSPIRTESTPGTMRRHDEHDAVPVILMLSGTLNCSQFGRESIQRPGEFVVLDRKPNVMLTKEHSSSLVLEVPRQRLERMLGPVSLYAGLTLGNELMSTSLFMSFIDKLIQVDDRLSQNLGDRMSSIVIDLLVASLSERMARDPPRSLAATISLQRAKAYVEANLSDPTLDPPQLAIAMGLSLRRIQQIFHEHGSNIADWIWQRRLELAAARLSDPLYLHLPLGTLAYACGFISQSHFSRRFKSRYGVSPSDYRANAVRPRT